MVDSSEDFGCSKLLGDGLYQNCRTQNRVWKYIYIKDCGSSAGILEWKSFQNRLRKGSQFMGHKE
jgi:hypothetical protein